MDTVRIEKRQVRMIAHRGLSGLELENTCPAFVAAGNRSYFGIETDVHTTADGGLVVIHDDTTGRVAAEDLPVEETAYETLRALPLQDKEGRGRVDLHIPSLEEYLRICHAYGKTCVLELKNPFNRAELEAVLAVVHDTVPLEQMIFISFDYGTLCLLRELAPEATIQFLCSCPVDTGLIEKLLAHRFDLDIRYSWLDGDSIERLHSHGIAVNCWTVDNATVAEQLAAWGVDYITTNILE